MAQQARTKNQYMPLVVFLFYFLLFSYPLLSLLWRRSYPFLSTEVLVLFVALAGFSVLLTVLLGKARPVFVNGLSALLITFVFTLQFNLLLLGVVVCTATGLFAAWRLRGKFQLYTLPVLIVLVVGAYIDSFEDSAAVLSGENHGDVNSVLPPVVHIILDGFIGVDGLPSHPASETLRNEIYRFFDHNKFQVFPRAYSRYESTGDSLNFAMNFRHDGESTFGMEVKGRRKHLLRSNAQFDVMQELGYRFNIYQTGYLDFCQSNPDSLDKCWEYAQPNLNSIRLVSSLQLKLRMLVKVLVSQSTLLSDLVVKRGWLLDQGVTHHDPRVFSKLESDLLDESAGKYFFAHVLLPHGPFAFLSDCSISYEAPLWARYSNLEDESVQNDEVYELRTKYYFEQVGCALKSIGQLFEKMKTAGIFERSIVVVHGDHGSGIGKFSPVVKNLAVLTPADYRSNFSTLFAVKFPGNENRVDKRTLSLSTLLEEFTAIVKDQVSGPKGTPYMQASPTLPEEVEPYVFLQGVYPLQRVEINMFED